jgi:hypothetical protein
MNTQLKKLNGLEINLDLFYVISFSEREIRLQGKLTEQSVEECKKFVDLKLDTDMNWLSGSKGQLHITLCF